MRKINLTDTITPSVLALGAAGFGTGVSEENSFALMDRFAELGGNVLDTARCYGGPGHISEYTVGKWMKSRGMYSSGKMLISTKGAHPRFETMTIGRLAPQEIRCDCEESLAALGTDFIHIYWLHRDDTSLPVEGIVDTLDGLVTAGKIGCAAVSNWTAKRIAAANKYAAAAGRHPLYASQIMYSAAKPNPDAIDPTLVAMNGGEYAWYSENFFPVFAFTSQALGYYTKLDEGRLEGSARRIFDNPANRAKLPALKAAAEAAGRTVSQQALVEIIGTPDAPPAFPTVAIIGCKTLGQLNDSMAAAL